MRSDFDNSTSSGSARMIDPTVTYLQITCKCRGNVSHFVQTLEKVTGDQLGVDFSQSVNAANAEKNRYDNKIPCEFR